MIDQPKLDAYEATRLFPDGRAMQHPPRGTVPYRREPFDPKMERGFDDRGWVEEIPIPVDIALLRRGRNRFEIVCATCHGIDGAGRTPVAEQMELVKPPSFLSGRIRAYPPGRIFRVASEGFGLMPSYSAMLTPRDRWAVIAYIQALQLRDGISFDRLPPDVAGHAEEELR
jgi:mono/diheme cytochrome c family protein